MRLTNEKLKESDGHGNFRRRIGTGLRCWLKTRVIAVWALLVLGAVGNLGVPYAVEGTSIRLVRLNPETPFSKPVQMLAVPGTSRDVVVVEQRGIVRRFSLNTPERQYTVMDIRNRVARGGWEEGLLSIAFHPRFGSTQQVFAYYSMSSPRRSVIVRFKMGADGRVESGRAGDQQSEVILEVRQPYSNHNGGQLAFGPDGYLYIGLGDGGSGGDPLDHGQNTDSLLGSILRIDVDHRSGGRAYAVPPDNPFVKGGGRPEIWAYGLRNPWRFSFDHPTDLLIAADVGQNLIEEVDIIRKGGNYGWNIREGSQCFRPRVGCRSQGLIPPVSEYDHRVGNSITGGFVYRGRKIPWLEGRYLFGDYSSGTLWSLLPNEKTLGSSGSARTNRSEVLLRTRLAVSAFGRDASGEIYVLDHAGGGLYRLEPPRDGD